MQAIESENLILYYTDLRDEWPEGPARAFAARLPYLRRLALRGAGAAERASLAGIALAVRALTRALGHAVAAGELVFARGAKPRLAHPGAAARQPDFSISHSGPWAACAARAHGHVGFDVEMGMEPRITAWVLREAALKATGEGLRALGDPRARAELHSLEESPAGVRWRGALWQAERLTLFPGASACVVARPALRGREIRSLALAELFAS